MKTSLVKKLIASTLAAVMVVGMSVSAFASAPCGGSSTVPTSVVVEHVAAAVSAPATASAVDVFAAVPKTSTVAGVKSTVAGAYLAKSVNGAIVASPAADIAASYALGAGEKIFAKSWDCSAKASPAAYALMEQIATANGATVVSAVNFEIGKIAGGKYSLLPMTGAPIVLSFGIPAKGFVAGANYAIIAVRPGGAVEVLPAIVDGTTISFATTAGAGAYAIIRY